MGIGVKFEHGPEAIRANQEALIGHFHPAIEPANARQEGGDHYKGDIQPWDAVSAWGLGFLAGNVVKYVARYKRKGGVEDLKKARHYLDKLIEKGGAEP